MKNKTVKEWLIEHISDNPNITWGSLYRDTCYSKHSREIDMLGSVLKKLVDDEVISETRKDNNSYYNLGKQLQRNKLLKKLGI